MPVRSLPASIGFSIAAIVYLGDAALVRSVLGGYVISADGVFLAMAWTRRKQTMSADVT